MTFEELMKIIQDVFGSADEFRAALVYLKKYLAARQVEAELSVLADTEAAQAHDVAVRRQALLAELAEINEEIKATIKGV